MPFAYLRKQRESEARQSRRSGQPLPALSSSDSALRAIKIGLIAILVVPVLFNVPWLHSALGPGGLPDLWVRSVGVGDGGDVEPDCVNLIGDGAGAGFRFCEDIHRIPGVERDTVIISCDANRAGWNTVMGPLGNAKPRGQLWTFEYPTNATSQLEDRFPVPVKLIDFPEEQTFHPLGLSIFHQEGVVGGQLFVVNHREHRSSVELFHLYPAAREQGTGWVAQWQRSIVHPIATHTPNSIHALSESSFLVTNDHVFARRPGPLTEHMIPMLSQRFFNQPTSMLQGGEGRGGGGDGGGVKGWVVSKLARILSNRKAAAMLTQIETLLGLSLGWVTMVQFNPDQSVETDGVEAKIVASNIPFANGIAVSPDNKTLIVAATTYPGVFIYDIVRSKLGTSKGGGPTNWLELKLFTKLHLPFRVDNLAFTSHPLPRQHKHDRFSNHALLATGHPAPLQLISMARNPLNQTSSSWTIAITPYTCSLTNENISPFETGFQQAQPWEDQDAPLPAHHFVLSHDGAWSIRTLMQSNGAEVQDKRKNRTIKLASSASSFYHAYDDGGTLMVSGLYDGVLLCTNVGS
ncbi:uncharacterized protein UTRI_01803 [Ustilago trichophora]|uniref:Serum paraoxonase/arylesterase n=1 Tax=Ustilago trichophora TaxID=86804 RepID=A0A5C3DY30_9BASI|nr:uncharacterized protein UTRI_01803 [Ustilago trichophora]